MRTRSCGGGAACLFFSTLHSQRAGGRRARGLPGRFVQTLWPDPRAGRDGVPRRRWRVSMAAEGAAVYGTAPDLGDAIEIVNDPLRASSTWPAPGELAALRRRLEGARVQLASGRHAPGVRHLRQAVGGLARRAAWSDAAGGAFSLGQALLRRGRVRDAQSAFDSAQGYAARAGADPLLLDIAIGCGDAWIDLARLDEAERVLGAARAAAKGAGDVTRSGIASVSLARCLFWRGQYADALAALGPPPDGVSAALGLRHALLGARVAVGQRDLRPAMSVVADARARHQRDGDMGATAAIASTAAFVHLAIGDFD